MITFLKAWWSQFYPHRILSSSRTAPVQSTPSSTMSPRWWTHFPQGEETAPQAGRREVQEGVKVKCFVSTTLNPVWIAWNTCPLHDCESKYPCLIILLNLAACTSCHAFLKATGFGCARWEGSLSLYTPREFSDLFIQKYWFVCQTNYISLAPLSC